MADPPTRLYFDFVDPLSYLLEMELRSVEKSLGLHVERVGFELRPPPLPLTDVQDPLWSGRWIEARRITALLGPTLEPPRLVPWSRKAHELHVFAGTREIGAAARDAIFAAYFVGGRDIGRVDELVRLGTSLGLDASETKAVLDVDRHEESIVTSRRVAEELQVTDVPVIVVGGKLVEGFHNHRDLSTLLGGP